MAIFDFLYQKSDETFIDLLETISSEAASVSATRFGIAKSVEMIANAIAKSEFKTGVHNQDCRDELYYRFNIRPNENENATYFWKKAVTNLLTTGECLIVKVGSMYYVAQDYSVSDYVVRRNVFKDVVLSANGNTFKMDRPIVSDYVYIKYDIRKILSLLNAVNDSIHRIITASEKAYVISHTPKLKLIIDGHTALKNKLTGEPIDTNDYAQSIKDLITGDGVKIWASPRGLDLEQIKIDSNTDIQDYSKGTGQALANVCGAFNIPVSVFFGNITEKSDATNEFITYAVLPVLETINDALQAQLLSQGDFLKGSYIKINIAKFKHVDIVDSAANLDKLRSIGFSFDEILEMVGMPRLNNEFSQTRVVTKNYTSDLNELKGGEK